MSGRAFGTIVLYVVLEAADGGPAARVWPGDRIAPSVSRRSLNLLVDPAAVGGASRGLASGSTGPARAAAGSGPAP